LVQAGFGRRFSPNAIKRRAPAFHVYNHSKGIFQWTVLVMGLEIAGGKFQRMIEWVFRDTPQVDPYIDDVIIGSTMLIWRN